MLDPSGDWTLVGARFHVLQRVAKKLSLHIETYAVERDGHLESAQRPSTSSLMSRQAAHDLVLNGPHLAMQIGPRSGDLVDLQVLSQRR